MTAPRRAPVMVPVLVSVRASVEVMVAEPDGERSFEVEMPEIRTALAYVTPEGFIIDRIDDWEMLPQ